MSLKACSQRQCRKLLRSPETVKQWGCRNEKLQPSEHKQEAPLIIQIEATQLFVPSDWAPCATASQKYPSVPREEAGSFVNYLSQATS